MPTPEGLERVLAIAAGAVNDSLAAGTLTISDGEHTAAAQLDQAPEVTITENGARLRVVATFGEDAANFEWIIRELRSEGGVGHRPHRGRPGPQGSGCSLDLGSGHRTAGELVTAIAIQVSTPDADPAAAPYRISDKPGHDTVTVTATADDRRRLSDRRAARHLQRS